MLHLPNSNPGVQDQSAGIKLAKHLLWKNNRDKIVGLMLTFLAKSRKRT